MLRAQSRGVLGGPLQPRDGVYTSTAMLSAGEKPVTRVLHSFAFDDSDMADAESITDECPLGESLGGNGLGSPTPPDSPTRVNVVVVPSSVERAGLQGRASPLGASGAGQLSEGQRAPAAAAAAYGGADFADDGDTSSDDDDDWEAAASQANGPHQPTAARATDAGYLHIVEAIDIRETLQRRKEERDSAAGSAAGDNDGPHTEEPQQVEAEEGAASTNGRRRSYADELKEEGQRDGRTLGLVERARESQAALDGVAVRRGGTQVRLVDEDIAAVPDNMSDIDGSAANDSEAGKNLPKFSRRHTQQRRQRSSINLGIQSGPLVEAGAVPRLSVDDIDVSLALGGRRRAFSKLRNGKLYRRTFCISQDRSYIAWESDKKRPTDAKILSSQLDYVIAGCATADFAEYETTAQTACNPECCLVIHYRHHTEVDGLGQPSKKHLSLIADTPAICNEWVALLEQIVLEAKALINQMKRGVAMTHCSSNANVDRIFYLSKDGKSIIWRPGKGKVPVSSIKFFRIGQQTATFRVAKHVKQHEGRSLSLVYGDHFATLDLIAQTQKGFEIWAMGLSNLVAGAQASQSVMNKGSRMIKLDKKSPKIYSRAYWLSPNRQFISWGEQTLRNLNSSSGHKKVYIRNIKELRTGHKTDAFQFHSVKHFPPEGCISIVYGHGFKSLNLYIPDAADYRDWVTGLEELMYDVQEATIDFVLPSRSQLKSVYENRAAEKQRDVLRVAQAKQLLVDLNPNFKLKSIQKRIEGFMQISAASKKVMTCSEFCRLFKFLSVRLDLMDVMRGCMSDAPGNGDLSNPVWSIEQLQRFLVKEQRLAPELATFEHCQQLIEQYETHDDSAEQSESRTRPFSEPTMTLQGFTAMLMSEEGNAMDPDHELISQDMTLPFNHYFISSSHNTFLEKGQLRGQSSTEMYVQALHKGCRCLEIDCWDGPNGEPIVYHGHTLTSKILFRDVVTTINEYAFQESPYPLILSLENHCCLEQQKFMAMWFKEVFADKLVQMPEGEITELPSPEDLKYHILLKSHKPCGFAWSKLVCAVDDDGAEDFGADLPQGNALQTAPEIEDGEDDFDDAGGGADVGTLQDRRGETATLPRRGSRHNRVLPKPSVVLHKDFADLMVFTASVPRFNGFEHAFRNNKCWQMQSFGENRAMSIANNPILAMEHCNYAKRQNSRIFPAATRYESSNFNPVPLWNMGAQLVALNVQTDGMAMHLNQGKFRQNGACGYVKKPAYLLDPDVSFNPYVVPGVPVPKEQACHLTIRIISGQHLPRPKIINPYVEVEIHGLPVDAAKCKTEAMFGRGLAPQWNETFDFHVAAPQMALVRFVVKDKEGRLVKSGFVAEATLPFASLRCGYRHLRLRNFQGEPLSGTLFIHVTKSVGLEHSQHWWSSLSKPPVYHFHKELEVTKLTTTGIPVLDERARNVVPITRKTAALKDKVLSLYDKGFDGAPRSNARSHMTIGRSGHGRHLNIGNTIAELLEASLTKLLRLKRLYDEIMASDRITGLLAGKSKLSSNNKKLRVNLSYNRMRLREVIAFVESTIELCKAKAD